MNFLAFVLLSSASAEPSVFITMPHEEMCSILDDAFASNASLYNSEAVFVNKAAANCVSSLIEIDMTVLVEGNQRLIFVDTFMAEARSRVCNLSDSTMAAFAKRGWKFQYTFRSKDAEPQTILLNCR